MNKITHTILCCILCLGSFQTAVSQVVIVPTQPNTAVFKFDQLFQIQIINATTTAVSGYLDITMEQKNQQTIANIRSLPMVIQGGAMQTGSNLNWESHPQYGSNPIAEIFGETGKLPFGDYVVCYRFIQQTNQAILGLNCQEKSIQPFGLPELLSPVHEAVISPPYPLLTWRPPLPTFDVNVEYSLLLTERKKEQGLADALRSNFPLVQLHQLSTTAMIYPTNALPLEKDKEYVWQVTAFFEGIEIGKTSIWTFKFDMPDEKSSELPPTTTYATLSQKLGGSYYQVLDGKIHFKLEERYHSNNFTYKISHADSDFTTKSTLLTPTHHAGYNYHTIDFPADCHTVIYLNNFLILEVTTESGEQYFLRFKYQDDYSGPICFSDGSFQEDNPKIIYHE